MMESGETPKLLSKTTGLLSASASAMGFVALAIALLLHPWALIAVAAAILFRFYYKRTCGVCTSTRRLDGRTALITGANSGIGKETARDFLRRGARVLLACRDPERGQRALDDLLDEVPKGASVELLSLDLESLASVRACAAKVLETEPRLDILVNNAGAGLIGSGQTDDGLHRGLQVNHFGPLLFTLLLVDLLKKSAPSRIVFVSSVAHECATLREAEWLDYNFAHKIREFQIYAITKLANIQVTRELARRLRDTGVTVNSLHPGAVDTGIFRNFPYGFNEIIRYFAGVFFKTCVEGAQTTIHVAVAEELEGVTGRYFSDCKEMRPSRPALDETLTRAVWKKSLELLEIKDEDWLTIPP